MSKASLRGLFAEANAVASGGTVASDDELNRLTQQLLAVAESGRGMSDDRSTAAAILARLAAKFDLALDAVIESARRYSSVLQIDDASPYSPNAFDILAQVADKRERIVAFLRAVVLDEWGIARWAAIEVLCKLRDSDVDGFLREVAAGVYPPKHLDVQSDLRVIERVRGKELTV